MKDKGVTNRFPSVLISRLSMNEAVAMAVEAHIREISDKHQKVQELIEAEMTHSAWDEMRVAALKKEKLRLKDELEKLRTRSH